MVRRLLTARFGTGFVRVDVYSRHRGSVYGNHIVPAQPSSCHARWCSEPHHHNCELTHAETPFLDHATLIEVARDILPNKPKGKALIIRHLVAAEVSMLGMETRNLKCKADGSKTQVITHKYLHTNFQTLRLLRIYRNGATTNTGLRYCISAWTS